MVEPTTTHLLDLADELVLQIVRYIDAKEDLRRLALACKRLQGIAETALYSHLLIRSGNQALRIHMAFCKRPIRASSVRSLYAPYMYEHKAGIDDLNSSLRLMVNLRDLNIEAPCLNDNHRLGFAYECEGLIDYAKYIEFASTMTLGPQPRVQVPLQSLTLHSHNARGDRRNAFSMGKNAVIFQHPTIQYLFVSCFDVGEDVCRLLSTSQRSCPLKSLTFDECMFAVEGLAAILAVPKALERLTLGERRHHRAYGDEFHGLDRNPVSLLNTLKLQKHSLQYLKHVDCYSGAGFVPPRSLAEFTHLKEIDLSENSVLSRIVTEAAKLSPSDIPAGLHLRVRTYIQVCTMTSIPMVVPWFRFIDSLDYVLETGLIDEELALHEWRIDAGNKSWETVQSSLALQGQNAEAVASKRLRIFCESNSGCIPPSHHTCSESRDHQSTCSSILGQKILPEYLADRQNRIEPLNIRG